jgi:RNA polymerase sigma-70 factor (sigma-E family)
VAREASEYSDEFDAFFDKYYPAMIRSLTLISGDAEVASDAVQDAFIRAYAKWNRIRRYDRPDAWVRRVAINRSRDHFRAASRRRNYEGAAAVPAAVESAERHTDNRDLVLHALQDLPRRQRTAVALYYLEGLDIRDVAKSMNITAGAVKFHLSKGREKLAPIVGEELP